MVGIPGSGKTTYTNKNFKDIAVVIHSDAVREELGDTENNRTTEVWSVINNRISDAIKNNLSIVLDATNVSRKDRMRTLSHFIGKGYKKHCVVILCDFETCQKQNNSRDRIVPDKVLKSMLTRFQVPIYEEGWDDIQFINNHCSSTYLDTTYDKLSEVEHFSKFHVETIHKHSEDMESYMRHTYHDPLLMTAAKYHDIGKLYTHTVDDKGYHHFYGHANASAYTYLCGRVTNDNDTIPFIQYTALLIEHHMDLHQSVSEKLKARLGSIQYRTNNLYEDLVRLNTADNLCSHTLESIKSMSLLDFINTFDNWEKLLVNAPFNIKIKRDGNYILFKYNQISSDFSFRLVRESRGIIVKNVLGSYLVVCKPFNKFFNYGEFFADNIVWEMSKVTEKMDGSLIKIWYDESWHISTNGTIDAYKCTCNLSGKTFGEIFESVLSKNNPGITVEDLCSSLDTEYTYLFELVTKDNQVVIHYDHDDIYFLAKIHNLTGAEADNIMPIPYVNLVKQFDLSDLNQIIKFVSGFDNSHEGVVVSDIFGHRIKVKSPSYIIRHRVHDSISSPVQIINIIKSGYVDDIIPLCDPPLIEDINEIKNKITAQVLYMNTTWNNLDLSSFETRKDFALAINTSAFNFKAWLFAKYDNRDLDAEDFLLSLPANKIKDICNIN